MNRGKQVRFYLTEDDLQMLRTQAALADTSLTLQLKQLIRNEHERVSRQTETTRDNP